MHEGAESCDPLHCSPPCCALETFAQDNSSYVVSPKDAVDVERYVGEPVPRDENTSLPVEVTYRRLWGPDQIDAASLGLPIAPVPGQLVRNVLGGNPGPGGTTPFGFRAYLQAGCYERTLQPYAPFSQAFPPDIHSIQLSAASTLSNNDPIQLWDFTQKQVGGPGIIPTFQISRTNGLDGWIAYLRDQKTKAPFSSVAALSGPFAAIKLATYHVSASDPDPDALTNMELVVAPPSGTPLPTYVSPLLAQSLPEQQLYPTLPTPVTMTGRVLTLQGTPVDADLVFTATDISRPTGTPFPPSSFEFVARAQASVDPKTGTSIYSVLLPRGDYQMVAVPQDASSALTVVSRHVDGPGNAMNSEDIVVGVLSSVRGRAVVADGRPLAAAIVEALPTQCMADMDAAIVRDSTAPCWPRPARTTTATDGSFALGLDPGGYLLRVRPADGSHLPWVMQSIMVGSGSMDLVPVMIPAPVHLTMTLVDGTLVDGLPECSGNCVGNAVVQVFTDPPQGSWAIELGQAITDTSGHFEMDLAPPAQ